jgi:hypothetical protein
MPECGYACEECRKPTGRPQVMLVCSRESDLLLMVDSYTYTLMQKPAFCTRVFA